MGNIFVIEYEGQPVRVKEVLMGGRNTYFVSLTDQPPLALVRANDANGGRFWTSVPEGRQELAEKIGPLIAEQIKRKEDVLL